MAAYSNFDGISLLSRQLVEKIKYFKSLRMSISRRLVYPHVPLQLLIQFDISCASMEKHVNRDSKSFHNISVNAVVWY
jgi:hypothetical protein